jgi:hypothetical protein
MREDTSAMREFMSKLGNTAIDAAAFSSTQDLNCSAHKQD